MALGWACLLLSCPFCLSPLSFPSQQVQGCGSSWQWAGAAWGLYVPQLCCLPQLAAPSRPTLGKTGASLAVWELQGPGELGGGVRIAVLVYLPPQGPPLWLLQGQPRVGEPEAGVAPGLPSLGVGLEGEAGLQNQAFLGSQSTVPTVCPALC